MFSPYSLICATQKVCQRATIFPNDDIEFLAKQHVPRVARFVRATGYIARPAGAKNSEVDQNLPAFAVSLKGVVEARIVDIDLQVASSLGASLVLFPGKRDYGTCQWV